MDRRTQCGHSLATVARSALTTKLKTGVTDNPLWALVKILQKRHVPHPSLTELRTIVLDGLMDETGAVDKIVANGDKVQLRRFL
jgi:hypothetical protein